MEDIYSDIRPFNDNEIPAAMNRIAEDPLLIPVVQYSFPGKDIEEIKSLIRSFRTVEEIQANFLYGVIDSIIKKTVKELSFSGLENFDDGKGRLLISNHRDITLDAFILQYIFFRAGLPTSDITLGDNLLKPDIVVDLCRSNRMIKIIRKDDISPREFLENSRHLSEFLRMRIGMGRSIWIAQRNGRTKDGIDLTEPGLLKMVGMGSDEGFARNYDELGITPVAISYEYEPCDILKAIELTRKLSGEPYHKSENEDLTSILTGIRQKKGDVHFSITGRITLEELSAIEELPRGEQCKALADLIDSRILPSYRLFDTNYIASDLREGSDRYRSMYTRSQKDAFLGHLETCRQAFLEADVDTIQAQDILLGIYANPVERVLNSKK